MTFRFFILLLLSTVFAPNMNASEVDSITGRHIPLRDAALEVSKIISDYFQDALVEANQTGNCDSYEFRLALHNRIQGYFWTAIESDILNSKKIEYRQVKVRDSVYKNFNLFESPILQVASLGPLIRLGEHYVGTDKLGHFFQTGYDLYERFQNNGNNIYDLINYNRWTEQTYCGLWATGIFSYADLAANYDGFTFWQDVTNTYVECKNGVWSSVKEFDISRYVNLAWDENSNCNSYASDGMYSKVKSQLHLQEGLGGQSWKCPRSRQECGQMIKRYGGMAWHVVTQECISSYFNS